MTFTLLPFQGKNKQMEVFIDNRDIETKNISIDNLPTKLIEVGMTILYSLFVTVICVIITKIFDKIMGWDTFMIELWSYRKNLFKRYLDAYLIKPIIM